MANLVRTRLKSGLNQAMEDLYSHLHKRKLVAQLAFICEFHATFLSPSENYFLLEKVMASVGVEPSTFALLARRSNRLS